MSRLDRWESPTSYDPEADALYIKVKKDPVLVDHTADVMCSCDFDSDGKLLGIEIGGFSYLVEDEKR